MGLQSAEPFFFGFWDNTPVEIEQIENEVTASDLLEMENWFIQRFAVIRNSLARGLFDQVSVWRHCCRGLRLMHRLHRRGMPAAACQNCDEEPPQAKR